MIYSLYTPYSIYFRTAIYVYSHFYGMDFYGALLKGPRYFTGVLRWQLRSPTGSVRSLASRAGSQNRFIQPEEEDASSKPRAPNMVYSIYDVEFGI